MLYQPPPQDALSPPQISIDSTNFNEVEHFTYLVSGISNNASHQGALLPPVQGQQLLWKIVAYVFACIIRVKYCLFFGMSKKKSV